MNRLFFLIFGLSLLIHIPVLQAQDYVYSVTTGTAWAREVFPVERAKVFEQNQKNPVLADAPQFAQTFQGIIDDFITFSRYNDSIFIPAPHEAWIAMFERRARCYSSIYGTNNQRITALKDYFDGDDVPNAAYDSLYFWTRDLYFRNTNDIFLFEQLVDILIPHYEQLQDMEHLIFCYVCAGMTHFQASRMGDLDDARKSELYYQKVMNMRDSFAEFTDPLNRYFLISAYINLAVLHSQAGYLPVAESCNLTERMLHIYDQPQSQAVFQQDSLLHEFAQWSIDLFYYRGIMTYISQGHNLPQLRDKLYANYRTLRQSIGGDFKHLKNRYYAKLEYDDNIIEAFMGNITWDRALSNFEKLLLADPDIKQQGSKPANIKINYLNNIFQSHLYLIQRASLSKKQRGQSIKLALGQVLKTIEHYDHGRYPFEKGRILEQLATNPVLLQYHDTDEKRELLFRLIVLQQPITYVHVSMVAQLSTTLASTLIDQQPEYFTSIPGYETTEAVLQGRKQLLDLIHQSAIYHDLGKITMPTLVNNCFRKLTNHEFDLIKLHPEKSLPFFAIDPSFAPYIDAALGHHKWFDGDGYPASFKNRRSPYFPIINIVTLCDCLDAATENIGRNYHRPKAFDSVIEEFDSGAGTRYDPLLIKLIHADQQLYDQLKQTVNTGRYDHYYNLYKTYMTE